MVGRWGVWRGCVEGVVVVCVGGGAVGLCMVHGSSSVHYQLHDGADMAEEHLKHLCHCYFATTPAHTHTTYHPTPHPTTHPPQKQGVSLKDMHRLHLPSLTWGTPPHAHGDAAQHNIAGHCLVGGLAFGGCMATILGVLPISKLDLMLLMPGMECGVVCGVVVQCGKSEWCMKCMVYVYCVTSMCMLYVHAHCRA